MAENNNEDDADNIKGKIITIHTLDGRKVTGKLKEMNELYYVIYNNQYLFMIPNEAVTTIQYNAYEIKNGFAIQHIRPPFEAY